MKKEIKEFLEGKEGTTLKEIYNAFSDKSKPGIRSYLNTMTKDGELKRVAKGVYSLPKLNNE